MALKIREYTAEELGLSPIQEEPTPKKKEFTAAELGLTSNVSTAPSAQKEYTPQELGILPPVAEQKPEDVGFLARAGESLRQGLGAFGQAAAGREIAALAEQGKTAEAQQKMEQLKAGAAQPVTPTLTAEDIQRIAKEKGLLPAGAKVPSFIVEQVLKSGPEMAVPMLTAMLASSATALTPAAPFAPAVGLLAGIGAYGYEQYGHFMERQALEKKFAKDLDPETAKTVAAATAPIGFFVDRFALGLGKLGIKEAGKAAVKELAERRAAGEVGVGAVAKVVGKTAAKRGTEALLAEAPTEILEQVAERFQADLPLYDEEAKKEYFEAGWSAAAVGGFAGSSTGAYSKYREYKDFKQAADELQAKQQKEKEKMIVPEEKLGRADTIRQVWSSIESKAKELEAKKAKEAPPAEAVPEPVAPSKPGVLDVSTLKTFGINPISNAHKALLDTDITTPEGQKLLEDVLDKYEGKVNYDAVTEYLQTVPKEEPVITEVPTYEEPPSADVSAKDSRSKVVRQRARAGMGMPVERLGAKVEEVTEPAGRGLGDISGLAEQRVGDVGRGEAAEPSALEEEKFVPNEAWLARAKEAEDNFDTVKARYDKVASNAKSTQKQIDKATTELEAAIKQLRKAQVAENPPIEEAPAVEREAPPGFEWYKETTEDGRVQEGLRRIQEAPTEVPTEEVVPEEPAPVEEAATEELAPTELTEEELAPVSEGQRVLDDFDEQFFETKGEVKRYAQKLVKDGWIDKEQLDGLDYLFKDKDMSVDDVGPELRTTLQFNVESREAPVETQVTEEDLADLELRKRGKTLAGQLRALDPYHPLIPDLVSADVDDATIEAAREVINEETASIAARKPVTPEEEAAALAADKETEAQVDALMETLEQAKDTIARGLEQALNTKLSVAPEDRVSMAQVLSAIADLMYVYIKQGVKSMGEAIRRARKEMGSKAKGVTQEQMVTAYRAAEARVSKETKTKPKAEKKSAYEEQYKKTGLNQEQRKKESEFDRFKSSPVESVARISNKIRSYLFSFDFAFNKKVLNAMRKAGVTVESLSKAFYELQVSQAVRADSMADLFLEKGSIAFDPELVKFVIKESATSMKAVRDSLSALAKQYGVPEIDFRKYASAAFIAQRSKGLVKANSKLQQQVLELTAKGEKDKAKKLLNKRYKLVHMTSSEIEAGLNFFKDFPELQDVFETWNDVREKTLNFAQQQGLYTAETVNELLDVMDYVPFYRIEQIEAQAGPKQYTRGLLDTLADKAFKGSHKDVNDIFDNMERWTRYMIKKSMNNAVAQQKIKWYKTYLPDDIRPIPRSVRSETGNTVAIWEDGKLQRYEFQGVDGETMVKGFTGLEPVVLNGAGAFLNMLRKSANFQRLAIVTNPIFSILQVPMDMFTAMFSSGVRYPLMIPLQVMKEIPATILGMSEARKTLRETGTVGRNDFYREYSAFDVAAQQEVKQMKTLDKILKAVVSPLHALSVASDNVVRQAVYNQVLLESKDKARAANAAEEVINFRRTGSSGVITIFRQMTPFVNANLQALHVSLGTLLGSGINPDTRAEAFKRVMATGAQIAAVSFLYTAMKSGDDDYEKLDPAERDRFFVLNGDFKVPMRNDVFTLLFKVIPEHTYNYLIAQSEDGAKMRLAFKNNLKRALAVPSPIPTLLTPMIEAGFNIDTVNNRPLLGAGQEGIEAELQFSTKYTSEFAKMLGENSGVSPIVIDNFIRDWTGAVGVIAATAMNEYIAENRGVILPEKTLKETLLQYPFFSQMLVKDVGSRNIADFYELKQEINRVVNSYNRLNGYDFDKAKEYLYKDRNLDKYNIRANINAIQGEISNMRKYERYVRENKQGKFADPAAKAEELRRIDKHIQDMLGAQSELNGRMQRLVQVRRAQAGM